MPAVYQDFAVLYLYSKDLIEMRPGFASTYALDETQAKNLVGTNPQGS